MVRRVQFGGTDLCDTPGSMSAGGNPKCASATVSIQSRLADSVAAHAVAPDRLAAQDGVSRRSGSDRSTGDASSDEHRADVMRRPVQMAVIRSTGSSQRLWSCAICSPTCHGRESVRRTIPRKRRRLVRTEKIVGDRIRSRCASAGRWSSRIRSRAAAGTASPSSSSTRASHQVCPIARVLLRDDQLARHEVVVRHDVGGEMREVAQAEGAQRIAGREVDGPRDPHARHDSGDRPARISSPWWCRRRCCRRGSRTGRRAAGRRSPAAEVRAIRECARRARRACPESRRRADGDSSTTQQGGQDECRQQFHAAPRLRGRTRRRSCPIIPAPARAVCSAVADVDDGGFDFLLGHFDRRLEVGEAALGAFDAALHVVADSPRGLDDLPRFARWPGPRRQRPFRPGASSPRASARGRRAAGRFPGPATRHAPWPHAA